MTFSVIRGPGPTGPAWRLLAALVLLLAGPGPRAAEGVADPTRGILIGPVTDALDGHPVSGVRIEVRDMTAFTDDGGVYRLPNIPLGGLSPAFDADVRQGPAPLTVRFSGSSRPAGVSLRATAPGYAPYQSDRITLVAGVPVIHGFSLSPLPSPGTLRIVLNWGAAPEDLDARMLTPPIEGQAYEVYYPPASRGSLGRPPYVALDIDQTRGFGPETITVARLFDGTYRYSVHNYSAFVNLAGDVPPLAGSGATVKIYAEDGEVQSITVPETGPRDLLYWHVFDLDGRTGSIRVVNALTQRVQAAALQSADAGNLPVPPAPRSPRTLSSLPDGARVRWDFGDGTGSEELQPVKLYDTAGTYTVRLSLVAGGETNTVTKPDYITVFPVNAQPTLDPLPDLVLPQNSGPIPLTLTGLGAGRREPDQTFTVSVQSEDPAFLPLLRVDAPPGSARGTLELQPARGVSGTNRVTVTVLDDGSTDFGGTNRLERSFRVVVLPNRPPGIDTLPHPTLDEGVPLLLTIPATDPELPWTRLSFRLLEGPPGLQVDVGGTLTWTPSEDFGPDRARVRVEVSDDGTPPERTVAQFTIDVLEVNQPPSLALTADPVIDEATPYRLVLPVSDPDRPANAHRFRLLGGPPGLTLATTTGQLNWTPGEEQGPGIHPVTVEIRDNGLPPLATTNTFRIVVREKDAPPTVRLTAPLAGSAFARNQPIRLEAAASDPDQEGGVARVEFLSGTTVLGEASEPPYAFVWSQPPPGVHRLTARALDRTGLTGSSTAVVIAVEGGCVTRPDTLVAWWSGEGDAADRLGLHHAAWSGPGRYTGGLDPLRKAFDLRETLSTLAVPHDPALSPEGPMTLSVWIRQDTRLGPGAPILHKFSGSGTSAAGYSLEFNPLIPDQVRFVLGTSTRPLSIAHPTRIPLGQWTHLAAVYDGTYARLYVNGRPATNAIPGGALRANTQPLRIGQDAEAPPAGPRLFRGLIDEPFLVAAALPDAVIEELYNSRGAGLCEPFIAPANQPPTLAQPQDLILAEDSPALDLPLEGISAGTGDDGQTLTVTVATDRPDLFPDPSVFYVSPAASGVLTLQPEPGRSGFALVTVTVRDDGGTEDGGVDSVSRSFQVTVTAVNDPPVLSRLPDQVTAEDAPPLRIPIQVADEETAADALVLEAVADSPLLLPPGRLTLSGSGPDRTLELRPAPDEFGTATVQLVLRDGNGAETAAQFRLTVNAVDDPPTLDPLPPLELLEDTPLLTLRLGGISPGPTNELAQPLAVTARSDSPGLIPDPGLEYVAPERTGFLTLRPVPGASGEARITVTVSTAPDPGRTNPAPHEIITRTFTVTVYPVNDPPRLDFAPDLVLDEDLGGAEIRLTVEDDDTPAADLELSAVPADPGLLPADGLVLGGAGTHRTLRLRPAPDRSGTTSVAITARDREGRSTTLPLTVSIRPVNDAPSLDPVADVELPENAGATELVLSGLSPGPADEAGQSLTLDARVDDPALLADPVVRLTPGSPSARLALAPRPGRTGTARVTLTLRDDGGIARGGFDSVTRSFQVRVMGINDPPVIGPVADVVLDEDAPAGEIAFVVGDPDDAASDLTVTAAADRPALFTPETPAVTGVGSNRVVRLQPAPDASGEAWITLAARDRAGATNAAQFRVTVAPVNDPPSFDPLPDLVIRENTGPLVVGLGGLVAGPADEAQTLVVTATSDRVELVPHPEVEFTPPATRARLTLRPAEGRSGSARIRVTARDDGGTERGGRDRFTREFEVLIRSNRPPVVTLVAPAPGAELNPARPALLRAEATDPEGGLARVEFLVDGAVIALDPAAPFTAEWPPTTPGPHVLAARAFDADGGSALSAPVPVTVLAAATLALTHPTPDTTVCPESTLTFVAELQGPFPDGARVEFLVDGQVHGRADAPPFTWVDRTGVSPGPHRVAARLVDGAGRSLAESAEVVVVAKEACADIALLRRRTGPEVENLRTLLTGDDLGHRVDVLDAESTTLDHLTGYQLVIWAGHDGTGEQLRDTDVELLDTLHRAGRPVYLIGPRLAGDAVRLGPAARERWERLIGQRLVAGEIPTATLAVQRGEPGDPIADGPRGEVAGTFAAAEPPEPVEPAGDPMEVKVVAGTTPVLLVAPPVCEPDFGQTRRAVQNFAVGGGPDAEARLQRERLFKNTVTWLLRGWYCENLALDLALSPAAPAPSPTVTAGDLWSVTLDLQHSGGCGAQGVTLGAGLPPGWEVVEVESSTGSWSRTDDRVRVSLGCLDRGASPRVTFRLRAGSPGDVVLPFTLRADALGFREERHLLALPVRVEAGGGAGPARLEIRRSALGPQLTLRLRGDAATRYRLQRSATLREWTDAAVLEGPEADWAVPPPTEPGPVYYRAVTP